MNRPYEIVSGSNQYPAGFAEISALYSRYRVIKCEWDLTFYPSDSTSGTLIGASYYGTDGAGVDLDKLYAQPGSLHVPVPV
jgi:hypothetical protein